MDNARYDFSFRKDYKLKKNPKNPAIQMQFYNLNI